jgi:hypothetical protein
MSTTQDRVSQRAPRSCQPCSRRKLRCSKQIPCSACVSRGVPDDCCRESVILSKHTSKTYRTRRSLTDVISLASSLVSKTRLRSPRHATAELWTHLHRLTSWQFIQVRYLLFGRCAGSRLIIPSTHPPSHLPTRSVCICSRVSNFDTLA